MGHILRAHRETREQQHTLATTTSYYFLEREMDGKRERNRCDGKEQRVIPPLVWLWPVDGFGLLVLVVVMLGPYNT